MGEELHGLSADVLDRFALAADPRADTLPERLFLLAGRGVAGGLLALSEAAYLHLCVASRCGSCATEAVRGTAAALVAEIRLADRVREASEHLLRFADLLEASGRWQVPEAAAAAAAAPAPPPQPGQEQRRAPAERAAAVRTAVGKALASGAPAELEAALLDEGGPDGEVLTRRPDGPELGLDALLGRTARLRGVVGKLHGAAIEALDALPSSVMGARAAPAGRARTGSEALEAYLQHSRREGAPTPWPLLAELARRPRRRALGTPATRSSALCDADELRLFRGGAPALSADFDEEPPYRDASGAHSWHGAPALSLLRALQRRGFPQSFSYWAVFPEGMRERREGCSSANFVMYDPTACMEEAGYGGVVFYVAPDRGQSQGGASSVQARVRPRAWASGREDAAQDAEQFTRLEDVAWPPEPPSDPVDVLFLQPMAGNCALLPELLASAGDGRGGAGARLVYVPINPTLPPPLLAAPDFRRHWRQHVAWGREATAEGAMPLEDWVLMSMSRHFLAQCSLAQACAVLEPLGYQLLFVEHLFAVLALRPLAAELLRATGSALDTASPASLFEAWRAGWFCSPVSRTTLLLEDRAGADVEWLAAGAPAPEGSWAQRVDPREAVCGFLRAQGLLAGGGEGCGTAATAGAPEAAAREEEEEGAVAQLHPSVVLRRRVLWALEAEDPAPGVSYHLGGGAGADPDGEAPEHGARGTCTEQACECFAPWRGPRCDVADSGSAAAQARPYRAAVHYIVNEEAVHVAELMHALRNLWRRFNARFDYPVLVFHDGLSPDTRTRIALAAPQRVWFHRLPADFLPEPAALPPDLQGQEDDAASHHSFSAGYRAQSRFRAGPLFAHPAVARLDYTWSLDTDSMFPADLTTDPFEEMHANSSLVLGYRYITSTSAASSKNFGESTFLYAGSQGVDLVRATQEDTFLSKFLMTAQGWADAPIWNTRVVMTDCEMLRVAFFKPGTQYYKYFQFLDAMHGFWLYRWGDHAVRGLGTGIALWLRDEMRPSLQPKLGTYVMHIPYAHQNACFCEDPGLKCVALQREASGEPAWPPKKQIWECRASPPKAEGAGQAAHS